MSENNLRRELGQTALGPKAMLVVFCSLNLLVYLDRGAIASNGVNAEGLLKEFSLTLFQDGLLPAAFMVGLLVASPVFAEAAKFSGSFRLIGYGISMWTLAVLGSSLSTGFYTILICRMIVGVGEASFVALAAPFIDDCAPKEQKTSWLAFFYLCIPLGYALGFLYGGIIASAFGWRAAFLIESLLMVPFVIFFFQTKGMELKSASSRSILAEDDEHDGFIQTLRTTWKDVKYLLKSHVYSLVVAGMTCYTAVIGSYAFYGPQAGKDAFDVPPKKADVSFGIITVITGILGTLLGGVALDFMGSSLRNGMVLCCFGMVTGACCIIVAFLMSPTFGIFCIIFGVGELFLFFTQAPSNALILWSVPAENRPLAISLSVVAMHLLGDVPMPPILGILQTWIQQWRVTMSIAALLIVLGGVFYGLGIPISVRSHDYRNENAQQMEAEERAQATMGEDDGHDLLLSDSVLLDTTSR